MTTARQNQDQTLNPSTRGPSVKSGLAFGSLDRIAVRWNKTRWRCKEDYCGQDTFIKAINQGMPVKVVATVVKIDPMGMVAKSKLEEAVNKLL